MDVAARQELADILRQARVYLEALQEDGVTRVDVSLEAAARLGPKARPAARTAAPAAASRPSFAARPAPRPAPADRPVTPARPAAPSVAPPAATSAPADPVAAELRRVAAAITRCAKCPLHRDRMRAVPGQGNPHPEILFVGEGPGIDEDRQGLPFVGEAGQLLTKMIEAMGLTRGDVFIATVVRCRPPADRKPAPDEIEACLPYLREQIALLKPKVIVALGAIATQTLLGIESRIGDLRGQWQRCGDIDLMPTFHPAYLLRVPAAKREVWADLQDVLKRLGRTPPPRPETRT